MNTYSITQEVIGKAIQIHQYLGPGLLESTYKECLFYELSQSGLAVEKEVPLPVIYKEVKLDHGYRIDLLVENNIVLELKTVEQLNEVHQAQVLTYMKLGGFPLGYLLNFNVALMKNGVRRFKM
ncbi:MAG: GxxExxY protein [Crocinitomicaceae bacterium]|nr:GxxExxY protein [Crocinitomicaceae bacterium]